MRAIAITKTVCLMAACILLVLAARATMTTGEAWVGVVVMGLIIPTMGAANWDA